MNRRLCTYALALLLGAGPLALASDTLIAFDPLTVKPGEEMRIQLFNPTSEPIEVRVFAYNAAEGSYDEGPKLTLAAGKMRFFDFKAPKDFVGIGGVIETTPDPAPAATNARQESRGGAQPEIVFQDILVSSVKSKGSLQHRTANGQSQTMGYSFGAMQTGSWAVKTIGKTARAVSVSNWVASSEL